MKLRVTEDKYPKYAQRKAFPKFRSIRAEIRFKAKTIVTSLPRDIYSDRPKNNIIIKFSLCVRIGNSMISSDIWHKYHE